MFADDTTLVFKGQDNLYLEAMANEDMLSAANWLDENKLSLNIKKTKFMHFNLSKIVRDIPKHNVLIIGGDMNAQFRGETQHMHSYHKRCNRNGEYLQQFMNENHLKCLNSRFQKKKSKLWTHTYPNNTKAQLDYLMINEKWINSVKIVKLSTHLKECHLIIAL